jgi:hypothetical protein
VRLIKKTRAGSRAPSEGIERIASNYVGEMTWHRVSMVAGCVRVLVDTAGSRYGLQHQEATRVLLARVAEAKGDQNILE